MVSLQNCVEKSVNRHCLSTLNLLEYANLNRDDDVFNDVTIIAGNEKIPGNRLVLSCSSTFFEKMFKVEMKEKYEHDVNINGFDGKSIKSLIDYIYKGSIEINNKNVVDLLQGADYLQLYDVREFCLEFLVSILALDNWFVVLKIANLYEDSNFTHQVYRYISDNFDEVAQSDDFKKFSYDDVKELISNLNRSKMQETSIYRGIMSWLKHEEEIRKDKLLEMLQLIEMDKLSADFLKEVVLKDCLIQNNNECQKFLLTTFVKRLQNQNEKYRQSKIVSIVGGRWNSCLVKEVLNLYAKNLIQHPNIPESECNHCSVKLNDCVYSVGGMHTWKSDTFGRVWPMDLKKQKLTWEKVAGLTTKRSEMGAAVHRGTLVVAGGRGEEDDPLASSEYYIAATDEWKLTSPMSQERQGNALVSCKGVLYVLGGWDGRDCLSSVERLSDLEGTWEESQPMQNPRRSFAAVNCANVLYAIGGQCGDDASTRTNTVERYNPDDNEWVHVRNMNTERYLHAACVLHDRIYVVGGRNAKRQAVKSIECYDPLLDTWSIVRETEDELCGHSIFAL